MTYGIWKPISTVADGWVLVAVDESGDPDPDPEDSRKFAYSIERFQNGRLQSGLFARWQKIIWWTELPDQPPDRPMPEYQF